MRYNLIGKTYGLLRVIDPAPKKDVKSRCQYWICECQCGNKKTVRSAHLRQGLTKSCGCLLKRRAGDHPNWGGCGEISGDFFWSIVAHAKQRNISVEITIQQIWDLFLTQNRKCALSGLDLTFQSTSRNRDGSASLDRKDSSKGYSIDNVWWVHKNINTMKWDFSVEEFKFYCKRVSEIAEREYSLKT